MAEQKQLDKLNEEIAAKSIINHALHLFPKAFINNSNEIILIPKYNHYFQLEDVDTELIFKCKMLEWISRPIANGMPRKKAKDYLWPFNQLLKTNFDMDDMLKIYDRLGNSVNRRLCIKFIESGYDMDLLKRD
ncbi:MAG: hypothetical protein RR588_00285 [Solibacillus sp.]